MEIAYSYVARGAMGEVRGVVYAERSSFARAKLKKMGLNPKTVRLSPFETLAGTLREGFDKNELEQFYRYFARLENKGVARPSALADAVNTVTDVRLKGALAAMSEAVGGSGMSVSQAMSVAGFPARDCDLVRNVEGSTGISTVLVSLADELKRAQAIARSIKKLLIMPTFLFYMAAALLYMSIVFISPRVYNLFKTVLTNVELPEYALAYYEGCELFNQNLVISSVLYGGSILAFTLFAKSEFVVKLIELMKPVKIARQKADYAALWGSFSLLFAAGVHKEKICAGLATAASTKEAKVSFGRMRKLIRDGREIDDAVILAKFPLFIANPISAAHKSSSLVEGAKELSEKLIIDVELFADKAAKWVEVITYLVIAMFVALFAMLTVVPMLSAVFSAV